MSISLKSELQFIGNQLRQRFSTVALDFLAPARLVQPDPRRDWHRDLLGGFVVSIMAVPQVLAYAMIAGVPPVMGLYSLVIVTLIAGLWCYTPHLNCGPSNASSLMLGAVLLAYGHRETLPLQVALIALIVGLFQIVAAILGVGNLIRYVSRTVIAGYTTAIGALIFLNQVSNFIGTKANGGKGLFARVWASLGTIPDAHAPSVITGLATVLVILVCSRVAPRIPSGFFSIVVGGLCAWGLRAYNPAWKVKLVEDVQRIPGGLPTLVLPQVNLGSIYELAGPAIALGMLACIEIGTVAKNLAMRTGRSTKPNQDILGLGFGNFAGAFFGAMPGSVSFTRSEFSYRSGVTSRLGIVVCALTGLVIVMLGRDLLGKIPVPALAALLMWLSIKLLHPKHLRVALLATYSDALVFLTTCSAAIFLRLDTAIYLGVLVSMALFLRKASVPRLMEFHFDEQGRFRKVKDAEESASQQIVIVHVEGEMFFGAAETFQEEIWRSVDRHRTKVVILRLRNAQNLDASGVMVLEQLVHDLRGMGIHLLISGTSPEIDRVVERSGLHKVVGEENYFPSVGNFLDATRRAVVRANQLVGVASPQVRLFYDKAQETMREAVAAQTPADTKGEPIKGA